MKIIISNFSGIPIYEQIQVQIQESILLGELKEGDMLPSIRQLATSLRVSVITITRAYAELEKDDYISPLQGKGYFVKKINKSVLYEKTMQKITKYLKAAIKEASYIDVNTEKLKHLLDELEKGDPIE